MSQINILNNIISSEMEGAYDEQLYFRTEGNAYFSKEQKSFILEKRAAIRFDTYFNSFSIGKWYVNTGIDNLWFSITHKGHFLLKFYHYSSEKSVSVIAVHELRNGDSYQDETFQIDTNQQIKDGLIFFELIALEKSSVKNMFYGTRAEPVRNVDLGIVITTYKREDAVSKTVDRLKHYLHDNKMQCSVSVIDNGKSLNFESQYNITVIQNENLGGSGGFARGLYHYKEQSNNVTHCLFMDDDASCELESIWRTYKVLEYSKEDQVAVIGSMMLLSKPGVQHEKGAKFDRYCRPVGLNVDLTKVENILDNEVEKSIDYGGWWFFAFPIKDVTYPYPFFVRGDDVDFCFRNGFQWITLNGIGSWQEDFFYKEAPLQVYLDNRSHLLHHIHFDRLSSSNFTILLIVLRFVMLFAFRYQYNSAWASLKAFNDVMKGPKFFEENLLMQNIFEEVRPWSQKEKMQPISVSTACKGYENYDIVIEKSLQKMKLSDLYYVFKNPDKNRLFYDAGISKISKFIFLNGHLLPSFLFKAPAIIEKTNAKVGMIFRRPKICMYHSATNEGVILTHSKKEFWKLMFQFSVLTMKFVFKRKRLIEEYRNAYPYMTSKEFWHKEFFRKDKV